MREVDPDEWPTDPLASLIWDQELRDIGVPMVLFTSDTLAAAERPDGQPGAAGDSVEQVARAAGELGLEPAEVELFSLEAYRLQTALGERVTGLETVTEVPTAEAAG